MLRFGAEVCGDLNSALRREWLETNGIGGFASSTIIGLNTRRYHGLLVAATQPPRGRMVLLSKLEDVLVIDGRRYELGSNAYPGVIHPAGYRYQHAFRLDPFPIFTWHIEDVELHKSIFLIQGENSVIVQYLLRAQGQAAHHDCRLQVQPLIAFRGYHETAHENAALNRDVETIEGLATITPYAGVPALHFAHDAGQMDLTNDWCYNFEYERERERGLDFREDLYRPFALQFDLNRQLQACIIASTAKHKVSEAAYLRGMEVSRRRSLGTGLAAAADQFLVGNTIIAGYHWFTDWGRDAMISLPGLAIATGRPDVAKRVLLEFAKYVDQGMLPNCFPDAGEQPQYNTVDATLWFFEAIRALGDTDFVFDHLYGVLQDIIRWHQRGTRFGIHLDRDGLLSAGAPGVQLTWMDAKVGDWVVTPRNGKPVEIQALWYNALRIMSDLARKRGENDEYAELAGVAHASFNALFWNESAGCLYDVIDGDQRDASIRPNQLLAISLSHKLIEGERAKRILAMVERELLTPYGLRTLARTDPHYRGRYEGDQAHRDAAYHQGTVWPWLMGPFIAAYLDCYERSPAAVAQASAWLDPLRQHRRDAGLGTIAEIFDGDPPHEPRGCIAQAWSVGEILRISALIRRL